MSDQRTRGERILLWWAQGMGTGRAKVAPGTWGTIPGLALTALLLIPGNLWFFIIACILSIPLSVHLCTRAEQILNKRDPGSVVIDEIIAVPISFLYWIFDFKSRTGLMPTVENLFVDNLLVVGLIFAAFRFFDILKPWPVGPSQKFPKGWGVTIDDVLAAGYVNLGTFIVLLIRS